MKSLIKLMPILALLVGLTGCATVHEVTAKYYGDTNLASFKTYRWASNTPQISSSMRADQASTDTRVRETVDRELAAKGYVQTDNKPVDFLVDYLLEIKHKTNVLPIGYGFTSEDERTSGRIILSILNPDTKQLMWRGSADAEVYRYDFMEMKAMVLEKAIQNVLSSLPESGT
ncbi:MAG: DUF4136 domain-containing protein [Candidatus Omnitrophica bacterium]|nr:DUF4136 domain-containing protein [Candidatus Omnitrophota bacterium]MDD5237198.1 DUF4136 domain-containing protein [Candidatus Omnitrophota bacterium]MDD5610340.1 DUF4136 domain-containing protein [Candidatus Omnitrophota bacterium]